MKIKYLILISILFLIVLKTKSQEVDPYSEEYQDLKIKGLIPQPIENELNIKHPPIPSPVDNSMLIPLDESFTLALSANDDGFTEEISLPFSFQFYGNSLNSFYINNNGNVSFWNPYFTYTPTGFPINDFPMLASFWADVDTRGSGSGLVYYRIEPFRVIVIWDHVGYFNSHYDKLCTFELIFTDGTDPLIGVGNNVAFCYEDMQWTTGDASSGSGGFGGSPATVGANKGDGINYFLIGRFDHEGADYDGPGGNPDGVSYLDYNCFSFNTGGTSNNIPPVPQGFPTIQPVEILINDVYSKTVSFISPEIGQITNVIVNIPPDLVGFNYTISAGNVCSIDLELSAGSENLGTHDIEFIATDDGTPQESTTITLSLTVTGLMELEVDPDSLFKSLCDDETTSESISFTNVGDGTINFSIDSGSPWITLNPVSGSVLPGENTDIQIMLNSSGLSAGYYYSQIAINTNIPDNPQVLIPVVLEVLSPLKSYIIEPDGDNENNDLTGTPDFDLDAYLCKGDDLLPVEFNFFIDQSSVESAELVIETFDVDQDGGFGLTYSEENQVFFNGTLIGTLLGSNENNSFTTLTIPSSIINKGLNAKNLVQIYVSVKGKYWCTIIQSAELKIYNCSN